MTELMKNVLFRSASFVFQEKGVTSSSSNIAAPWLQFFSTLIWQILIVYLLLHYRRDLRELLHRVSKLKLVGVEGEFQSQTPDAKAVPPNTTVEIKSIGEDGFLTSDGVKQLISKSGLLQTDEQVQQTLRLFSTSRQKTWLVSTDKNLFCVLDDPRTRKSGRLIQWKQPKSATQHVHASQEDGVAVVDIGEREGWLYSANLHPDPRALEREIRSLFDR